MDRKCTLLRVERNFIDEHKLNHLKVADVYFTRLPSFLLSWVSVSKLGKKQVPRSWLLRLKFVFKPDLNPGNEVDSWTSRSQLYWCNIEEICQMDWSHGEISRSCRRSDISVSSQQRWCYELWYRSIQGYASPNIWWSPPSPWSCWLMLHDSASLDSFKAVTYARPDLKSHLSKEWESIVDLMLSQVPTAVHS